MSLSSVLVDRARTLIYEAKMQQNPDGSTTPVRVEGTTQMQWIYGPYFDCRVDSPAAPKRPDAAGGRTRTAQTPTLLFDVYDDNDDPVVLNAEMRIAVESEVYGTAVFELTGEPELIRKKIDLVCGQASIVRVLDFGVVEGPVVQFSDTATTLVTITPSGS